MASAELVSKAGTKSIAWEYFGLQKGIDGQVVDDVGAMYHLYTAPTELERTLSENMTLFAIFMMGVVNY